MFKNCISKNKFLSELLLIKLNADKTARTAIRETVVQRGTNGRPRAFCVLSRNRALLRFAPQYARVFRHHTALFRPDAWPFQHISLLACDHAEL